MKGAVGLRSAGELPSDGVYDAHLLADLVALKPVEGGEAMERAVGLDEVPPVSPLQSAEEMDAWMAAEATRVAEGSRRGVSLGPDRRDWLFKISRPDLRAAPGEEREVRIMPAHTTPEEMEQAEVVLRDHSRRVH